MLRSCLARYPELTITWIDDIGALDTISHGISVVGRRRDSPQDSAGEGGEQHRVLEASHRRIHDQKV